MSRSISVRVPDSLDRKIRAWSAVTGHTYSWALVEGAQRVLAEHDAQAPLQDDLVALLTDEPGARLVFEVAASGDVQASIEPDSGRPLEQVAEVRLRDVGHDLCVLEIADPTPEGIDAPIRVALLPAGVPVHIELLLEDLLDIKRGVLA